MTKEEAIKKLEAEKSRICMGCMHPQQVGWCEECCCLPEAYKIAIEALKVEPRHGIWVESWKGVWHSCSVCGGIPLLNAKGQDVLSDYCPHCGVRMYERRTDE